jgi:hypothetical protein
MINKKYIKIDINGVISYKNRFLFKITREYVEDLKVNFSDKEIETKVMNLISKKILLFRKNKLKNIIND